MPSNKLNVSFKTHSKQNICNFSDTFFHSFHLVSSKELDININVVFLGAESTELPLKHLGLRHSAKCY